MNGCIGKHIHLQVFSQDNYRTCIAFDRDTGTVVLMLNEDDYLFTAFAKYVSVITISNMCLKWNKRKYGQKYNCHLP